MAKALRTQPFSLIRPAILAVVSSLLFASCSLFGGFDEDEAPAAFPAELVEKLRGPYAPTEQATTRIHAQAFDVLELGGSDPPDRFLYISQPEGELFAIGLRGSEDDVQRHELYEHLLKKCRSVSMESGGDAGIQLDTVSCGREFVVGLEKNADGEVTMTFLRDLDDLVEVSHHLAQMNRRGWGMRSDDLELKVSMDWVSQESVPLQPGEAKLQAPGEFVWLGIDYMVKNESSRERAFDAADVEAVDVLDNTYEADREATARSNGGSADLVIPAGQSARVRTLVPVRESQASQRFRVTFNDLGENGTYIAYRTVDSETGEGQRDTAADADESAAAEPVPEATESDRQGGDDDEQETRDASDRNEL